ncbi:MAG: NADAR family protein [Candidatus Heimdallarchaeaceae archaeon]
MELECQVIDRFAGDFADLSNFAPVVIYYKDLNFPTVEHAFVASKSNDGMFRLKISQLPAKKAGKAKRMGRKILIRTDWDMIKIPNMKRFLMQKFSYERYRTLLISTGNAQIVEGNYWHDNYWGNCDCPKCKNIVGQNQLGKLLMKVRGLI